LHQITRLASQLLTVLASRIFVRWRKIPTLETFLKVANKFLSLETLETSLKVAKKFLWKLSLEGKTQSQLVELTCHKEAKANHGHQDHLQSMILI